MKIGCEWIGGLVKKDLSDTKPCKIYSESFLLPNHLFVFPLENRNLFRFLNLFNAY